MVTVIPDVKVKVNEFIIQWLSQDKVFDQLSDDLSCILNGKVPDVVPTKLINNRSLSPPHHKHPASPRSSPRVPGSPNRGSAARTKSNRTPSPAHEIKKSSPSISNKLKRPQEIIPQFYFPMGKPSTPPQRVDDSRLSKIKDLFEECKDGLMAPRDFGSVTKAAELPLYWKCPLFEACSSSDTCSYQQFLQVYEYLESYCHDEASKFLRVLTKGTRSHIIWEDFNNLIQDVIDTHPGMSFLDDAPEFHARYIETVTGRIMYTVNRSWSSKITITELRESNFLKVLASLEDEPDINQVSDYFSYEHFYVIYCKFWEIDTDHDLIVSLDDVMRHADGTVNPRALERLFEGTVTYNKTETLTYFDFIRFLLAEEDKSHPTAIEYWFRIMDLDGDGFISLFELEYFYQAQLEKMRLLGVEECSVLDCICQALDLVRPKEETKITLTDIKKCKQPSLFFNIFLNIQKFLDHELKDPFSNKDGEVPLTDWEKFAAREYEDLIADEELNKQYEYEDDFEDEDEEIPMMGNVVAKSAVETYGK
ncbi:serine/threonine-protein phosphatase 2A regulatory subunit B'' subunit beta-like [Bolinopsis microptera]|uniref:serine/threonine-protein phosphatase 2A regulatory subunit B'' subunit beta-like n=1 Tax=Bolinopsis microptera TaxID=2820187 RepID=UPI00307AFC20